MKRDGSSYKKTLIFLGLAFIVIATVLLAMPLVSAAGTLFAEVKVDEKSDFVSVESGPTTIGNIKAKKINVEMFADQIATVKFKTGADVLDAVVMDDNGDVIETRQFSRGSGDIDFSAGGTRVIVLLDPGNNRVYGDFAKRIEFLQKCENFSIISMEHTINDILKETASQDFVAVIKVWVKITQREITNVQGVWSYDEDNGELGLKIKGDSNLPRSTKIVYTTFGVTGYTKKVNSDGEINFDIDFDKIDAGGDCKIEMEVGKWSATFKIDPPPKAVGIYVEPEPLPKSALKPTQKSLPTPKSTPTIEVTRVLADPPESVKESVKEAVMEVQRAQAELAEKREQTSALGKVKTLVAKWLFEIMVFTIAIVALLILRKKMKK